MPEEAGVDLVVLIIFLVVALPIFAFSINNLRYNGIAGTSSREEKSVQYNAGSQFDGTDLTYYKLQGSTEEIYFPRVMTGEDMILAIAIADPNMASPKTVNLYGTSTDIIFDKNYVVNRDVVISIVNNYIGSNKKAVYDFSRELLPTESKRWQIRLANEVPK